MGIGKKTGGRDFKPGQAPKSPGRPRIPEELKAIEPITQDSYKRILNKYTSMSREQLQAVIKEPSTPAIEIIVCSIIAKAMTGGDQSRLESLLNRAIGPVPKQLEVSGQLSLEQLIVKSIEKKSES